ncbi:transposase [Streptomyces mutabilis]|uniref:transposase n=1 Tax=Streptomyces mutabilis TaxID=67332 RepID=UPI0034D5EE02
MIAAGASVSCEQPVSSRGAVRPRQFRLDQSVVGPGVPLTDAQWARIEPLLPDRTPKRGGRWRDHREVIDAIAFKFQTGTQWVHLAGTTSAEHSGEDRLTLDSPTGALSHSVASPLSVAGGDAGRRHSCRRTRGV